MTRPLIIGYGNTLAGDDGVGPLVIAALRGYDLAADLIDAHQLYPEMAEPISRASRVIFIDAEVGDPAGVMSSRVIDSTSDLPASDAMSHYLNPAQLLTAARILYGHAPPAHLVTVTGSMFDLGEGPADAVQAAIPQVVDHLVVLVT